MTINLENHPFSKQYKRLADTLIKHSEELSTSEHVDADDNVTQFEGKYQVNGNTYIFKHSLLSGDMYLNWDDVDLELMIYEGVYYICSDETKTYNELYMLSVQFFQDLNQMLKQNRHI